MLADLVAATADPFVGTIYDLAVLQMAVGRVCLPGDAAFVARPHTAAGTAKAAADGVELAATLGGCDDAERALQSGRTPASTPAGDSSPRDSGRVKIPGVTAPLPAGV